MISNGTATKGIIIQTLGQQEVQVRPCEMHTLLVRAASNADAKGFQEIHGVNSTQSRAIHADGVYVRPETFASLRLVMQTGDCPVVLFRNQQNGAVLLVHAGRPALTPSVRDGKIFNIVTKAVGLIAKRPAVRRSLAVHITTCICANCFPHNDENGRQLVQPFREHFGNEVFENVRRGTLCLRTVIKTQLYDLGVHPSNVTWDGHCTRETSWLSSHRRGDTTRNTIVVSQKPR